LLLNHPPVRGHAQRIRVVVPGSKDKETSLSRWTVEDLVRRHSGPDPDSELVVSGTWAVDVTFFSSIAQTGTGGHTACGSERLKNEHMTRPEESQAHSQFGDKRLIALGL
jgi:hypothetical protein